MDCREAQQLLDLARPESDDLRLPELADAEHHLSSCLDCQEIFQKREIFDRAFGSAIRHVPVPAGLNQRILAALAEVESAAAEEVSSEETKVPVVARVEPLAPSPARSSRRFLAFVSVGLSLALLIALGTFWFWPTAGGRHSMEHILATAGSLRGDIQNYQDFDQSFEVRLPQEGWDTHRLKLDGPFGCKIAATDSKTVAVYTFEIRLSSRENLVGRLLIVPASRVSNPPAPASFLDVAAISSTDGRSASASWTENDMVFICSIDGHAGRFSTLQRLLAPQMG